MTERLTLSIDAMGGDNAPRMIVDGVDTAVDRLSHVRFLLYGDETLLQPLLDSHPHAAAVSEVRHADDVISNDEKPGAALRGGADPLPTLSSRSPGRWVQPTGNFRNFFLNR